MSDFLDKAAKAQQDAADAPQEERPEIWNPKEAGTQLMGVVDTVAWPFIQSANEHRWMLEITDFDDKKWTVWCGSAVLRRLIVDVMPAVGSEIVIMYDGNDQKTKSGYNFKSYQMAADRFDVDLYQRIMTETKAKQAVREEAFAAQRAQANTGGITAPGDDGQEDPF